MVAAVLALDPTHTLAPFHGPVTTIEQMVRNVRGARGERSVLVRSMTERVVAGLQPKDYLSEIIALRNFVAERCRYLNDPLTTEWVKDPERMASEILYQGSCQSDCEEQAQLIATMARQCGREAEFVTVGFTRDPEVMSHVFARAREPKTQKWLVCDPVAGSNEARMLSRVTTFRIWRID